MEKHDKDLFWLAPRTALKIEVGRRVQGWHASVTETCVVFLYVLDGLERNESVLHNGTSDQDDFLLTGFIDLLGLIV